ncbi:MAG TPA: hypothetical protein VHR65_06415 [Solirubrobacterales bacterium]|jgi:hypothetical protein|nr:hypothetical protein [Solirubrobacterales bacterium]
MKKKIVVAVVLGLLVVVATANAFHVHVRAGNLVLDAEGGFEPNALPKYKNAPIITHGGGTLSTISGELPPILDTFVLEFDKHGALDTTGLPFCTQGKLVATDVAAARRACKDAIVGEGFGSAVVKFPEQDPIKVGSPITLFNGPKKGGNDTIIAHAHLDYPGPTTFIVPIVIEKIHKGVYGYRIVVKIPKIAGGYGHPISGSAKVGKKWIFKGKQHSYINARCETGHFQVRGEFSFKGGPEETPAQAEEAAQILHASFLLPCKVRK